MQLTLSAYVIGLAVGQLIYGPVSDRVGRKPVLLAGMAVYAILGGVAVFSTSVESLVAFRFIQALGGCAGFVIGRAVVRDTASNTELGHKLSLMNLMVILGPGLSPALGALLTITTGWRSIFVFLCVFGIFNLVLSYKLLPETNIGTSVVKTSVVGDYLALLRSRHFMGHAIAGGCAANSIYAYIGMAPFIFVESLGRSTNEVGLFLMLNIAWIWLGTFSASKLSPRLKANSIMNFGNCLSFFGAFALLIFPIVGPSNLYTVIIPAAFISYGGGVVSPIALGAALHIRPNLAGSASGLYGFVQMVIGASSASIAALGSNATISVGATLLAAFLIAQVALLIANRRP